MLSVGINVCKVPTADIDLAAEISGGHSRAFLRLANPPALRRVGVRNLVEAAEDAQGPRPPQPIGGSL